MAHKLFCVFREMAQQFKDTSVEVRGVEHEVSSTLQQESTSIISFEVKPLKSTSFAERGLVRQP